jgi:hypothetical protein
MKHPLHTRCHAATQTGARCTRRSCKYTHPDIIPQLEHLCTRHAKVAWGIMQVDTRADVAIGLTSAIPLAPLTPCNCASCYLAGPHFSTAPFPRPYSVTANPLASDALR